MKKMQPKVAKYNMTPKIYCQSGANARIFILKRDKEIASWQVKRNTNAQPLKWRFTDKDARVTLKKLYPALKK